MILYFLLGESLKRFANTFFKTSILFINSTVCSERVVFVLSDALLKQVKAVLYLVFKVYDPLLPLINTMIVVFVSLKYGLLG